MKQLEIDIKHSGFDYHQEFRNDTHAIYSQSLDGVIIAYELIKIRKNEAGERFGVKFENKESYPTDKSWGSEGKTYKTYSAAEKALIDNALPLPNLQHGKRKLATLIG